MVWHLAERLGVTNLKGGKLKFLNLIVLANVSALMIGTIGCATTPTDPAQAIPVKADHLYSHQTKSSESDAMITVIRDSGMEAGACRMGFYINGELVGDFSTAEIARFYIKADEYRVGVGGSKVHSVFCVLDQPRERETTLKPGQAKRFRISVDANGTADVLPY